MADETRLPSSCPGVLIAYSLTLGSACCAVQGRGRASSPELVTLGSFLHCWKGRGEKGQNLCIRAISGQISGEVSAPTLRPSGLAHQHPCLQSQLPYAAWVKFRACSPTWLLPGKRRGHLSRALHALRGGASYTAH